MFINRRTFKIKPGRQEEAVQALKDVVAHAGDLARPTRVQTAMFGPFDVIVLDIEFDTMSQYDAYWQAGFEHPAVIKFFESWDSVLNAGGGINEIWEVR
jgi:hypothetical protein